MDTYELRAAFSTLYQHWETASRPAYYAYQSSIGRRRAVLYSAQQTYLPQLKRLEAEIPVWADAQKVRGPDEKKMWLRAARIRRAITNADPDDVTALLPA